MYRRGMVGGLETAILTGEHKGFNLIVSAPGAAVEKRVAGYRSVERVVDELPGQRD